MDMLNQILVIATIFAAAITFASLGGLFSEKSGIVNIALDSSMIAGALGYAIIGGETNNIFLAYLTAIVAGAAMASLLAFAAVKLKADHVIIGTAMNLLAPALATVIISMKGSTNLPNPFLQVNLFDKINIVFLFAIVAVILAWLFFNKTKFGLRYRAAGENPNALAAVGISVQKYRFIGVLISGALAGIGGAIFIYITSVFHGNVQGAGFIALAIMIAGQWKPLRIIIFATVFGLIRGYVGYTSIGAGSIRYIYNLIPYVATLLILIFTSKNSAGPAAAGQQYDPSGR